MSDTTPAQSALGLPDLPGIEEGWNLVQLRPTGKDGQFDLSRTDEAKLAGIVQALGEGLGLRQTARAFRVSPNTVLAVRERFFADIEASKQRAAMQFANLRDLAVERMIEEIDEMPRQTLPIVAGVAAEKAELLRGAPTARVQHDHTLSVNNMADFIESLPVATPVASGERDVQKAAGGALPPAADTPPALAPAAARSGDSQSLESAQVSQVIASTRPENGQIDPQKERGA